MRFVCSNESEIWSGIMHQYIISSLSYPSAIMPRLKIQTKLEMVHAHAVDNTIKSQHSKCKQQFLYLYRTMSLWMCFMAFGNYAVKCGRKLAGATRPIVRINFMFCNFALKLSVQNVVFGECNWNCVHFEWKE